MDDFVICPAFQRYLVSKDGRIIDRANDSTLSPTRESGTNKLIVNVMSNMWRWTKVSLARMVLCTYKPLVMEWMYKYAKVVFLDGNQDNVHLDNMRWGFVEYRPAIIPGKNAPIDKLVTIPGFSNYKIDGNANVYSLKTKQYFGDGYVGDTGYLFMRLIDDLGCSRNMRVHRLMAMTFLPHPIDVSDMEVNHKNGDPLDNSIDNLEWVTPKENITHAVDMGLITGISVCVYDCIQDKELSFTSMKAAAHYIGVGPEKVRYWLTHEKIPKEHDGFMCKYATDDRPWPDKFSRAASAKEKREGCPIIVKNIETGEVKKYRYVNDFQKVIGGTNGTILRRARSKEIIPYAGYLIRESTANDDSIVWPNYSDEQLKAFKTRDAKELRRFKVTFLETNEVVYYTEISAVASVLGITSYMVNQIIESGDGSEYQVRIEVLTPTNDTSVALSEAA